MKNIKLFHFILLAMVGTFSCEEEKVNAPQKDGTKPGGVSEITAIGLPGGARITYALPADKDLLYVKAVYDLASGKQAEVKSSIYQNYLEIFGLGDTNEHEIKLYSVDRSENASEPVSVYVTPTTPPVITIGESLVIKPDFGGINISFANPTNAEIAILIKTYDEFNDLVEVDTKYTSVSVGNFAIRGYPTAPREFVVIVRDRWENYSSPVSALITPLFEEPLDKKKFKELVLTHDFKANDVFSGWQVRKLWDESVAGSGVHTAQGAFDPSPLPEYPEGNNAMFTFDLGQTAKLYRVKLWQRGADPGQANSWGYAHGNPKLFDLYGIATTPNSNGTLVGWTKLLSNVEIVKPSGLPFGVLSNDDRAALVDGHEFVLPATLWNTDIRYIRFVCNDNWSGTRFVHFMEVSFWGKIN